MLIQWLVQTDTADLEQGKHSHQNQSTHKESMRLPPSLYTHSPSEHRRHKMFQHSNVAQFAETPPKDTKVPQVYRTRIIYPVMVIILIVMWQSCLNAGESTSRVWVVSFRRHFQGQVYPCSPSPIHVTHMIKSFPFSITARAVYNDWTGLLDWTTGMDYWNGLLGWPFSHYKSSMPSKKICLPVELHPTLYKVSNMTACLQLLLCFVFRPYVDNHAVTVMQIEVSQWHGL